MQNVKLHNYFKSNYRYSETSDSNLIGKSAINVIQINI